MLWFIRIPSPQLLLTVSLLWLSSWGFCCDSKSWQALTMAAATPTTSVHDNISSLSSSAPQHHNMLHLQRRRWKWPPPLWRRKRQQQHRRSHHSTTSNNKQGDGGCGTRLTFRRPTPESVAKWFASSATTGSSNQEFNHDSVGMTNPCLHISVAQDNDDNEGYKLGGTSSHWEGSSSFAEHNAFSSSITDTLDVSRSFSTSSSSTLSPVATSVDNHHHHRHVEDSWWPGCTSCGNDSFPAATLSKWRVIRYRRRIGRGQECYERVRNAALDWEFAFGKQQQQSQQQQHSEGGDDEMGILAVHPMQRRPAAHVAESTTKTTPWSSRGDASSTPSSSLVLQSSSQQQQQQPADVGNLYAPLTKDAARHVLQLWSGPGGRRLVTYTKANMFRMKWLPPVFAVNPVMVVYDLIDQRGPGTTYTSTAYATLKGHWLSGEERVTVALRDGIHGDVDVEILSYSRPAPTLTGRLVWPLVGQRQRNFFQRQLESLDQVARRGSSSSSSSNGATTHAGRDGDDDDDERRGPW